MKKLVWALVALVGAFALGGLALHRGESINAMWIVVAAGCFYAIGYRVYSAWIAARVLVLDPSRPTPAIRPSRPVGCVGAPLRGHRGARAIGRADAGRAIRLPARNDLDSGRRCV